MKIALYVALFLCAILILFGLSVWCIEAPILMKLLLSSISMAPGVAFGAIIIEELFEDWF